MKHVIWLMLFSSLLAVPIQRAVDQAPSQRATERLEREVRHELVMLPFYGVFDNFVFTVVGYNITLMVQVTRPTLQADAERVVKRIEGVEAVDNKIEVLPLSPKDDHIR